MRSLNLKRAALVAIRLLTVACVLFGATVLFIKFR
jgi:hypothetical protein